jgi:hypothetical protein
MKQSWLALGLLLVSTWAYPSTRVQVEGHGNTVDQAKQNGFRNAIEQVVGQVVVSDQEVRGDQLTKDWIGGYSAGYVDDFEILETHQEANETVVKMNVAVASSKIAKRMMSSGNKTLIIEGEHLQAQIDTQLDQRDRGDQLIAEVLTSYPYNAFVVNSGQTDIGIGQRREVYIDVPYEIHWSKFWLEALNETLGVIAVDSKSCNSFFVKQDSQIRLSAGSGLMGRLHDTPCGQEADMRVSYKQSGAWLGETRSYYFYDRQTLETVNGQIQTPVGRQHIGLRVDLKDAGGNVVDSRCARIDTSLFVSYTEPQMEVVHWNDQARNLRPVVNGDASVYGVLRVHLHDKDLVGNVNKVTLTVEKTCV